MIAEPNIALVIAACLSAVAAMLHVGIVIGGAQWYRFFGAGERLACAAAAGRVYPTIVTLGIAAVLALWSAYALSGAGLIEPLPQLKWALITITAIYLARGLAIVPLLVFARARSTPFLVWSSLVCSLFGAVYLLGLSQVWALV